MKLHIFIAKQIKCQIYNSSLILKRNKTYSQWILKKKNIMEVAPCRQNPIITKLDTPEFHSIFTDELKCLVNIFKKYNYEIRVAGGAVRDILMHMTPKDLDFATTATPEQMKEMFNKENIRMINNKGEKHGTITARINNKENFEVTTLRIDMVTDGRHAEVDFTTDWKLDANRRDLTINSMYLDFEGNIYDYFFGYEDLEKRRVVFVGDSTIRIQEDYLRILRYFRFYGKIAIEPNNHDEVTIQSIKDNVNGLECISGERIWVELNKILEGNYSRELMNKIIECGMAKYIGLPENLDITNFNKVLSLAEKNKVKLLPCTAITSLLKNETEVMTFHERIKLSAFNRDLMLFIVENRDKHIFNNNIKPYQEIILSDKGNMEVKRSFIIQTLKYKGDLNLSKDIENWKVPHFPISGNIVKTYVKDAKVIGIVLRRLKHIWLDQDFKLSKNELINLIPDIIKDIDQLNIKSIKNK